MTDGRSPLAGHTRHAPRHRRLSTGRGCVGSTRCQLPHTMSKASTSPAHAAPSSLSNNHLPSEIRAGLAPCPHVTQHTPALMQHRVASHPIAHIIATPLTPILPHSACHGLSAAGSRHPRQPPDIGWTLRKSCSLWPLFCKSRPGPRVEA